MLCWIVAASEAQAAGATSANVATHAKITLAPGCGAVGPLAQVVRVSPGGSPWPAQATARYDVRVVT